MQASECRTPEAHESLSSPPLLTAATTSPNYSEDKISEFQMVTGPLPREQVCVLLSVVLPYGPKLVDKQALIVQVMEYLDSTEGILDKAVNKYFASPLPAKTSQSHYQSPFSTLTHPPSPAQLPSPPSSASKPPSTSFATPSQPSARSSPFSTPSTQNPFTSSTSQCMKGGGGKWKRTQNVTSSHIIWYDCMQNIYHMIYHRHIHIIVYLGYFS